MILSSADSEAIASLIVSKCVFPPFVDEGKFKQYMIGEIKRVSTFYCDNYIALDGVFFGMKGLMRDLPESCMITVTKKKGEWVAECFAH